MLVVSCSHLDPLRAQRFIQFSNILSFLAILNLDFIPALGLSCRFGGFDYLNKIVVVTMIPVGVSIILLWTYASMTLYARKQGVPYEKGPTVRLRKSFCRAAHALTLNPILSGYLLVSFLHLHDSCQLQWSCLRILRVPRFSAGPKRRIKLQWCILRQRKILES